MALSTGPGYVDHPAPSVAVVTLLLVGFLVLTAALVDAAPQGLLPTIVVPVTDPGFPSGAAPTKLPPCRRLPHRSRPSA